MTEKNTFDITELQQKALDGDEQSEFDWISLCTGDVDVEKNFEIVFDRLKKAAEQGHALAQYTLGLCYYAFGVVDQKDRCSSISFSIVSITMHVELLGIFLGGKMTGLDADLAIVWFKKAAEQNLVAANYWLGLCYQDGIGVVQNDAFAFECFRKAAEQDLHIAQYQLAFCYLEGKGVEQNNLIALEWLVKLAEMDFGKNDAETCFLLSELYAQGRKGIEKNEELASEWNARGEAMISPPMYFKNSNEAQEDYEKRCRENDEKFQLEFAETWSKVHYHLANSYLSDKSVENDFILGMEYMLKAVNAGQTFTENDTEDQYRFALRYIEDKGVEKNYNFGMNCMISAAYAGHAGATQWLFNAYLSLALPQSLVEKYGAEQCYKFSFDWCMNEADGPNAAMANLCLGVFYFCGKGVEQNNECAFKHLESARNGLDLLQDIRGNDAIDQFICLYLSICYAQGKGVEKSLDIAKQSRPNWLDEMGDILINGRVNSGQEYNNGRVFLTLLRIEVYKNFKDHQLAKEYLEEIFDGTGYEVDQYFKPLCLATIEQDWQLDEKNQELEAKNKQLQDAQKDLEDMMSMFAHKFRSPLDAIIYNTAHDNQPKLYAEAAQTMRGLLDIFSIISTDADTLQNKIKQDIQGLGSLMTVFCKTLDMILLHLLSLSGTEKIQQHYLNYAKAHDLCDPQISYKLWNEEHYELERQLQTEWEQSYAQLLSQSAPLERRLAWLEQHFFRLELHGFDRTDIQFKEYGITESFLTILLNEILINAFKYYSSADKQPVTLEWTERKDYHVLSCRNPSVRSERTMPKGSGKGHAFLSALARKTGSQFTKPKLQDEFVLEFGIANELLTAN